MGEFGTVENIKFRHFPTKTPWLLCVNCWRESHVRTPTQTNICHSKRPSHVHTQIKGVGESAGEATLELYRHDFQPEAVEGGGGKVLKINTPVPPINDPYIRSNKHPYTIETSL